MIDWFSTYFLILYAILYGITMKIADLLDEHGLKLFKGSGILFGVLWGIFGALLILGHNTIANIILAMNIAFIIRNRLDYLNHQIATSIIIISFLFFAIFQPWLFLTFFFIFLIFGSIKDYIGDTLKLKKGIMFHFNERSWYYYILTLIYSIYTGIWMVFFVFALYKLSYDITKYIAAKKGYE